MAERIGRAVVGIRVRGEAPSGEPPSWGQPAACGVVVSEDGLVLTAAAAVPLGGALEVVFAEGPALPAREVAHEPASGLLVLQIQRGEGAPPLVAAPLGDPEELAPGAVVMTVGNPFRALVRDGQPALSLGVVSAIYRMPDRDSGRGYAIETDAAINPGSFGGPLLDRRGRVVGIVVPALRKDRWLGLAAPIDGVPQLLARARAGGGEFAVSDEQAPSGGNSAEQTPAAEQRPGRLGIYLYDDDTQPRGAEIVRVKEGSPAAEAGLRAGDVVRAIDGQPVASAAELARALRGLKAGQRVKLLVEREGWRREFELVAQPAGPAPAPAPPQPGPPRSAEPAPRPAPQQRAFLGVALAEREGAVVVARVVEEGPAARAGIRAGDRLLAARTADGQWRELASAQGLIELVGGLRPGERLGLRLEREGWVRELEVVLGARPEAQGRAPAPSTSPPAPEPPQPEPPARKEPGYLGAYLRSGQQGVLVEAVVPGGPAEQAGLRAGDVIANAAGRPVRTLDELGAAMRGLGAGDTIRLGVLRQGEAQQIEVTLAPRPERVPERPRAAAPPPVQAEGARPFLGVVLEPGPDGLRIVEVVPGSPAARAQLEPGSYLREADGQPLKTLGDLSAILARKKPGDTLALQVVRRQQSGDQVQVQVRGLRLVLAARSPEAGHQAERPQQQPPPPPPPPPAPPRREPAPPEGTRQPGQPPATAPPAFLGVVVEVDRGGLLIVEVVEGSPAQQHGLRAGERLTAVDGAAVRTIEELAAILGARRPGDSITLTLEGAEGSREVRVALAARPAGAD
ncbi:MAG: hypothetical protein KatS3mg102_0884 [Planctomycetota bacterium]|nr:MAG: hypothetical protein KatS3mg102_0884 [Planctomycetota bacterium]